MPNPETVGQRVARECPFCGRDAVFKWDDSFGSPGWFVGCPDFAKTGREKGPRGCDIAPYLWGTSIEDATERWNRRDAARIDAAVAEAVAERDGRIAELEGEVQAATDTVQDIATVVAEARREERARFHGLEVLKILRGALTHDDAMVRAYATQLAEKLAADGYPQIAKAIGNYLAGNFGLVIQPAAAIRARETGGRDDG